MGRVVGDAASTFASVACAIGDRLGLFKVLAAHGPLTEVELATRAKINARYAREWGAVLASHGYLAYDPQRGTFALPPAHAAVLADEGGPSFLGGLYEELHAVASILEPLTEKIRNGGGLSIGDYPPTMAEGISRLTTGWFDHHLVQTWLPTMPDVVASLQKGIHVGDIGSGHGKACIQLAKAYPNSTFVGFDVDPDAVEIATKRAKAAGVSDRVKFKLADASKSFHERFDLLTAFDVFHDMVHPSDAFVQAREALKAGGSLFLVDIASKGDIENNQGPLGTAFYGFSLTYCLTVSMAHDGEALGTAGLPEPVVRDMAQRAGFSSVTRLPIEDPFNAMYRLKA